MTYDEILELLGPYFGRRVVWGLRGSRLFVGRAQIGLQRRSAYFKPVLQV